MNIEWLYNLLTRPVKQVPASPEPMSGPYRARWLQENDAILAEREISVDPKDRLLLVRAGLVEGREGFYDSVSDTMLDTKQAIKVVHFRAEAECGPGCGSPV